MMSVIMLEGQLPLHAGAIVWPLRISKNIPFYPCGSQDHLQRQDIKLILSDWDIEQLGRIESSFSAMQNVSLRQLSDRSLFDF